MKSIIILAAILSVFGSAAAQQEATLRLKDGSEVKGVISHISIDSVYITQPVEVHYADRAGALPVLAFPRQQISTVAFVGDSKVLPSTLIGLGIGALSGAVLLVTNPGDGSMPGLERFVGAIFMTMFTVGGGIGGLTYGLLAGRDETTFDMSRDSDVDLLRKAYGNTSISRR